MEFSSANFSSRCLRISALPDKFPAGDSHTRHRRPLLWHQFLAKCYRTGGQNRRANVQSEEPRQSNGKTTIYPRFQFTGLKVEFFEHFEILAKLLFLKKCYGQLKSFRTYLYRL